MEKACNIPVQANKVGAEGQTPQSVADVIARHSPGCADPKQQDAIRAEIHQLAPKLQQLHQVQQAQTQSGPKLGH